MAAGFPAAHICGRGGIGRLDGFRFRYLSGVRVRVPPPAPKIDKPRKELVDFYLLPLHYSLFTKTEESIFGK